MSAQFSLSLTPASRRNDGLGSVDAEARMLKSGALAENLRRVLKGFVHYPMRTTKELAALTLPEGWELAAWRTEVGRRAPMLAEWFLHKIPAPPGTPRDQREFRWQPTERGKLFVERMGEEK